MPHHEIKKCPGCGCDFECKAGNILQCECSQIILPEAITSFIAAHYGDCLCPKCLQRLSQVTVTGK